VPLGGVDVKNFLCLFLEYMCGCGVEGARGTCTGRARTLFKRESTKNVESRKE